MIILHPMYSIGCAFESGEISLLTQPGCRVNAVGQLNKSH